MKQSRIHLRNYRHRLRRMRATLSESSNMSLGRPRFKDLVWARRHLHFQWAFWVLRLSETQVILSKEWPWGSSNVPERQGSDDPPIANVECTKLIAFHSQKKDNSIYIPQWLQLWYVLSHHRKWGGWVGWASYSMMEGLSIGLHHTSKRDPPIAEGTCWGVLVLAQISRSRETTKSIDYWHLLLNTTTKSIRATRRSSRVPRRKRISLESWGDRCFIWYQGIDTRFIGHIYLNCMTCDAVFWEKCCNSSHPLNMAIERFSITPHKLALFWKVLSINLSKSKVNNSFIRLREGCVNFRQSSRGQF